MSAPWRRATEPFRHSAAGRALIEFVERRVSGGATVYPSRVFRALEFQPPQAIRVVILGQDPYHGAGQAQGLAFSVAAATRPWPPSLRNIMKEVGDDTGRASVTGGDLSSWAQQGVLLLNSALTVEAGAPQSHAGRGWEALTDALFLLALEQSTPVVVMLWGASAQRKLALIGSAAAARHRVLSCNHPSPLAARRGPTPFIGCRHFTQANDFLAMARPGVRPIEW